jgi:hypothetical protein
LLLEKLTRIAQVANTARPEWFRAATVQLENIRRQLEGQRLAPAAKQDNIRRIQVVLRV